MVGKGDMAWERRRTTWEKKAMAWTQAAAGKRYP
jgi:hypothetical protein